MCGVFGRDVSAHHALTRKRTQLRLPKRFSRPERVGKYSKIIQTFKYNTHNESTCHTVKSGLISIYCDNLHPKCMLRGAQPLGPCGRF